MTSAELIGDAFGRIRDVVHGAIDGLTPADLTFWPDAESNSIAWLVWHLTRIQDDHIAGIAGTDQIWTSSGWEQRFGLRLDSSDTGYGHGPMEVARVGGDVALLGGYFDAVHMSTCRLVGSLTDSDLDRIVDTHWNPPVTMGVRIVSVIADDLQHAGQAAYIRGLLEHR